MFLDPSISSPLNPESPLQVLGLQVCASKEVQAENLKCSWLTDPGFVPQELAGCSFHSFALATADSFLEGDPVLEGGNQSQTLAFFRSFLVGLKSNPDPLFSDKADFITSFIEKLRAMEEIKGEINNLLQEIRRLNVLENRDSLTRRLAETLHARFQANGKLDFPGGWRDGSLGHAVIIELDAKKGTVIIDNTGDGLNKHEKYESTSFVDQGAAFKHEESKSTKRSLQQLIAKTDPKKLDVDFFQALIELRIHPELNAQDSRGPDNYYEGVLSHIDAKVQKHPKSHLSEAYKKDQDSGTCAAKSVSTCLYYALLEHCKDPKDAVNTYKKMKFYWSTQSLVSVSQSLDERSPRERRVIREVSGNIARSADKLRDDGILSEEDELHLRATLEDIESKIKDTERFQDAETRKIDASSECRPGELELPSALFEPSRPEGDIGHSQLRPETHSSASLDSEETLRESYTPDTLVAWISRFKICINQGSLSQVSIGQAIAGLPPIEDPFWTAIPAERLYETMEAVSGLQAFLLHGARTSEMNSQKITELYFLTAILHRLASCDPEAKLAGLPPLEITDLLIGIKKQSFCLSDYKHQKILNDTLKYFGHANYLDEVLSEDFEDLFNRQEKQLFSLNGRDSRGEMYSGKLVINSKTIKTNPTLVYLSEFLIDFEKNKSTEYTLWKKRNNIDAGAAYPEILAEFLVSGKGYLPPSVRVLLEAKIKAQSYLREPFNNYQTIFRRRKEGKNFVCTLAGIASFHSHPRTWISFRDTGESEMYKLQQKRSNIVLEGAKPDLDKIDVRESYEAALIGCDPHDEVIRALSFCLKNPVLLKDKKLQGLISAHIFHPGRLLVQDLELLRPIMKRFVRELHQHALEEASLDLSTFVSKLGLQVDQFYLDSGAENLFSAREWLQFFEKELKEVAPQERNKAIEGALTAFLGVDSKRIGSNASRKELVASVYLLAKQLNVCLLNRSPLLTEAMRKWDEQVGTWLKEDGALRQSVLNLMCRVDSPDEDQLTWGGEYPVHFNALGMIINLETAEVCRSDVGTQLPIPNSIKDNGAVKKLTKGKITACRFAGNRYLISYGKGECLEVYLDRQGAVSQIYKEMNGKRYRREEQRFNRYFRNIFQTVGRDEEIWCEDNGVDRVSQIYLGNLASTPFYAKSTAETPSLHRKVNGKIELLLSQNSLSPDLLGVLSALKIDQEKIYCWGTRSRLHSVSIPERGLELRVEQEAGRNFFSLADHPGYHLTETQPIDGLSFEDIPYLSMKNNAGDLKVLFPQEEIEATANEAGNFLSYDYEEEEKGKKWLEFSVREGQLIPENLSSKLYQLYLLILHERYQDAYKMISGIRSLKRYSDEEIKLIEMISKIPGFDTHPSGRVLYLLLKWHLMTNKLRFPQSKTSGEEDEIEFIGKAEIDPLLQEYQKYFFMMQNAPDFKLTKEQEFFYLDLLEKLELKDRHPFKASFKQRRSFLETGKSYLGMRPVFSIPKVGSKISSYAVNALDKFHFDFGKHTVDNLHQEIRKSQFKRADFFEDNKFADLYLMAKNQDPILKRCLKLNSHLDSYYYHVLCGVMKWPSLFPSQSRIEAIMKLERSRPTSISGRLAKAFEKIIMLRSHSLLTFTFKRTSRCSLKAKPFLIFSLAEIMERIFKGAITELQAVFLKKQAQRPMRGRCEWRSQSFTDFDQKYNREFTEVVASAFTKREEDNLSVQTSLEDLRARRESASPTHQKHLDKEIEALEVYAGENSTREYWEQTGSLVGFRAALEGRRDSLSEELKAEQRMLLDQANYQQSPKRALRWIGMGHRIDWKSLQRLSLSKDIGQVMIHTGLDQETAEQLMCAIALHLMKSTRLRQIELSLRNLNKADRATDPQVRRQLHSRAAEALMNIRHYEVKPESIHRLWFEYSNQYFYREMQIKKLDELSAIDAKEVQAEMPTGFGKTKNMIPTLNEEKSAENRVPVNIWPANIEMLNSQDVQEQMGKSFTKEVDRHFFDRHSNFSLDSLKLMYNELVSAQSENRPVNMRSETIRAFQLHYVMCLKVLNESSPLGLKEEVGYFADILRIFRNSSCVTIDEVHVTMDPLDKLIYTLGQAETLPEEQWDFFDDFSRVLLEKEDVLHLFDNLQANASDNPELMDQLYEHILRRFAYIFKVPSEHAESFRDFASGKDIDTPEWVESWIDKEKIFMLRGMLGIVLKSCMDGFVDETYGLSKLHLSSKEFAIVYTGSDIAKETEVTPSQFKNPHETVLKTYFTYLSKGLLDFQILKLFNNLKQEAIDECTNAGKTFGQTRADEIYRKLLPTCETPLQRLSEEQMLSYVDYLNGEMRSEVVLYYIRHVISQQLKVFPEIIESTTQNFRSQFPESISFSATPPDVASHGPDTKPLAMKSASGQVTHLLLSKSSREDQIHLAEGDTPREMLEAATDKMLTKGLYKSLIDVGAQLKGASNLVIAKALAEKMKGNPDLEAILFYSEKDETFLLYNIKSESIIDPRSVDIDPRRRATFYDQGRSVGSDIPQDIDAVALLLMGKNVTKAQAGQAAGRNREWHLAQGSEWMLSASLGESVFQGDDKPMMNLYMHMIANQVEQDADKNFEAQLQQMENEIRSGLMDKLLSTKSVGSMCSIFSKVESFFVKKESIIASDMYRNLSTSDNPIGVLTAAYEKVKNKLAKISVFTRSERNAISGRLEVYKNRWLNISFPSLVRGSASLGLNCEVLEEVHIHEEDQNETQIGSEFKPIWLWKPSLNIYSKDWEKSSNFDPTNIIVKLGDILVKAKEIAFTAVMIIVPPLCVVTGGLLGAGAVAFYLNSLGFQLVTVVSSAVMPLEMSILGAVFLCMDQKQEYLPRCIRILKGQERFLKGCPVWKMSDVLASYLPRKRRSLAKAFSKDLLVSNNFSMQRTGVFFGKQQAPFKADQKPFYESLLIMDDDGKVQLMLMDQNDSAYFRKKLEDDVNADPREVQARTRRIAIVDYSLGIVAQGANKIEKSELTENAEVQKLLVQAKLLSGETKFDDAECAVITEIAQSAGKDTLREFVYNTVLAEQKRKRLTYQGSALEKILGEIR
jgi:hypothetical protein